MSVQLVQDLERVLTGLDEGWQPYGYAGGWGASGGHGIGGCIMNVMVRGLRRQGVKLDLLFGSKLEGHLSAGDRRVSDMIKALGFVNAVDGCDPSAMYGWNDSQCSVDAVRARVEAAIEGVVASAVAEVAEAPVLVAVD
jgi:hypothetical protein